MAKRSGQKALQEEINNDDDWIKMMENEGMYVVEIYAEFCGPCLPMVTYLKKTKMEFDNESLHYAIAKSDEINVLERFRFKSEPHWMVFFDGNLVKVMIGSDASRLTQLIVEELDQYVKFKNGEIVKEFIPISKVTDEELNNNIVLENFRRHKEKMEKMVRDRRMLKVRERVLKTFSRDIQMQTCVMFFPHTVKYIMVEKPLEYDAEELDEPPEPVMITKRVCEVATSCASKYEELIVIEAKEVQLTEENLYQLFFMEKEFMASFSQEFIDELLSRKVYSVMLSMPTVKRDTTAEEAAEPVPLDIMGQIELKLSTIVYGDGTPLNPGRDSLADVHTAVDEHGRDIPSLYTPRHPLSKASALTILFNKFCQNIGYIEPLKPLPQFLMIFDISKMNTLLPIIEEMGDAIINVGVFRTNTVGDRQLQCKDPELLLVYGIEKAGEKAEFVVAVIMDDKCKSMLRLVEFMPIYVSRNTEVGISDSNRFFPYNYDEMDGEIKLLMDQEARDDEYTGLEHNFAEDEEGMIEEENSSQNQEQDSAK